MHIESAHDGVNYFCTNCGLKFSTKSNLKAHHKKINACIGKTVHLENKKLEWKSRNIIN